MYCIHIYIFSILFQTFVPFLYKKTINTYVYYITLQPLKKVSRSTYRLKSTVFKYKQMIY